MIKRFLLALLVTALALAAAGAAAAQSSDKIIGRHRKASGAGAAKRVKSTLVTGAVKTSGGATGRFTLRTAAPDRMRIDIEAGDDKTNQSYNGKSAWLLDSRGLRTLLGPEAKRLRLEALLANGRLNDLSRDRIAARPAMKVTVEGREANAITLVKEDVSAKLFFDAQSNLLVKQEYESAEGVKEIFYGDYRAVDKVMEPFSIRIRNGAGEMLVTVERVEHNRGVDEAAFLYPRVEGAEPLPELEPLLKSITANQEKIEQLRERYTFRQTETQNKLDGKGQIKESEVSTYEVTPVYGTFVRRLISAKGKELSPPEREKEDRRVQKLIEDIVKRREKRLQKQQRARERGERAGEDEDEGNVTILDFLRICEITSVRRENFRGHEVIAFDFEPRKGFKPKNRAESFVSKLAGTMWIDEKAQQVARLEARLLNSFKIGGGLLASISPSSAVVIEQEKIGGEVWMPSYFEANMSARLFLFAKFNRSFVRKNTDFKKYQIEDKYELEKPKQSAEPETDKPPA
jgi:hypothetical protein